MLVIDDSTNLFKLGFEVARKLRDSGNDLSEYVVGNHAGIEVVFVKHGDKVCKVKLGNEVEVFYDGCIVGRAVLPVMLLYLAVHILQSYCGVSMPHRDNINAVIAGVVNKDLFWYGELGVSDMLGEEVSVYAVEESVEPGIVMSLNLFGSTISFKDGYRELLVGDNIPTDYNHPVCFIKTPEGIVYERNMFQIEDWDAIDFCAKLQLVMMENHRAKRHCDYTYKFAPSQMYLENPIFGKNEYIIYANMNAMVFNHDERTYYVKWKVLS